MHDTFDDSKSNFFYRKLVDIKKSKPDRIQTYWINYFDIDVGSFDNIYTRKVKRIKDKNMSEFNFKILNNILPCNMNLLKWKRKDSDLCSLCNVPEDIPHMLYYCKYARSIWDAINAKANFMIQASDVILGCNLNDLEVSIVTFISYFLYKMWLKNSFDGICRKTESSSMLLICDLQRAYDTYSYLRCHDLCRQLTHVIDMLRDR